MNLVSVIVPTYNRARFLGNCLDSVFDQTYTDLECIVVDGGSTDGSRELLDAISDDRLHVLSREEPQGLSNARNAGINTASGRFVLFLDSDDVLDSYAVGRLVETLESHPPNCAGVCANHRRRYPDGREEIHLVPTGRITKADIEDGNAWLGGPSCTLFRRDVFDRIGGFDESFAAVEDVDMHLRILSDRYMIGLDEVLCVKNMHGEQMTGDPDRMLEGYERLLEKHGSDLSKQAKAERRYTMAHLQARRGRWGHAREELLAAIAHQPLRAAYLYYYVALLFGETGYKLAKRAKESSMGPG